MSSFRQVQFSSIGLIVCMVFGCGLPRHSDPLPQDPTGCQNDGECEADTVCVERVCVPPRIVPLGQVCGDGRIYEAEEACDDGNLITEDGCSSDCTIELGWDCVNDPSECTTDLDPTPVTFNWVVDVEPGLPQISNEVIVSGIHATLAATLDGAEGASLVKNGIDTQSRQVTVEAGDQIALRVRASPEYETALTLTFELGSFSATWIVVTRAAFPGCPTVESRVTCDIYGDYDFRVPIGVTQIHLKLWGGGGGGGTQPGALGGGAGFASGTLSVEPNEVLRLLVARGGFAPGAGGGATYALRGDEPLAIAAGGGGGGSDGCSGACVTGGAGGAGGGLVGAPGEESGPYDYGVSSGGGGGRALSGGVGGSSNNGGLGGDCFSPGDNGRPNEGGRGGGGPNCHHGPRGGYFNESFSPRGNGTGGGGGAGYYGGGGGGGRGSYHGGGGGGGSSFVHANGIGIEIIGGENAEPANPTDIDYRGRTGRGGDRSVFGVDNPNQNGGDGLLILTWDD